ncbi:site-specific DNA-methyltransferase [Apilactobacillus xinyiensis]|uniref:site-specific DNA-methyltransferase n=1 Tax=Apilactobacillus xinyiensis TaxID=2841032 RepID=UPI003364E977
MELVYENKSTEEDILNKSKKIKCKTDLSIDNNYIFKGDNFNILSQLINSIYKNKIDLIYIDPPFATNNDFFIGKDRVSTISHGREENIAYSDKLLEDEYIEYIRERLILLKQLLSDNGSIYLHIDCKIGHYIKIIMDEIFGKENFINDIARRKSNPKNFSRKAFGNEKDMILFYSKKKGKNIFNNIRIPFSKEELNKKYTKIDDNMNRYNTVPIHAPGESLGPTGEKWHDMFPPKGRHWRTSPKELDKLNADGLIEWSINGNPRLKKYAKDNKGRKLQDIWLNYKDKMYPDYPTQKNQDMLDMIVQQSSNENSIVLDAFAGSGSTLRAAQKYCRTFIGIDKSDYSIELMKKEFGDSLFSQVTFIE